jgi:hypothetical protein
LALTATLVVSIALVAGASRGCSSKSESGFLPGERPDIIINTSNEAPLSPIWVHNLAPDGGGFSPPGENVTLEPVQR